MSYAHANELAGQNWRKPEHSGSNGNCFEFADQPDGNVAVRNSRDPEGPALLFSRPEMAAMIASARDGEFDDLA